MACGLEQKSELEMADAGLVVVIDDDPPVLEALALVIEDAGFDVVAVTTAEAARAALRGRRPDIVIADYRLETGLTGSDVIRMLRAEFGRTIPGILLTGDTSPERQTDAHADHLHLLHKPVLPGTLIALLRKVRSRGRCLSG